MGAALLYVQLNSKLFGVVNPIRNVAYFIINWIIELGRLQKGSTGTVEIARQTVQIVQAAPCHLSFTSCRLRFQIPPNVASGLVRCSVVGNLLLQVCE